MSALSVEPATVTLTDVPPTLAVVKGAGAMVRADGPSSAPITRKMPPCAIPELGSPGTLPLAAFTTEETCGAVETGILRELLVRPPILTVTFGLPLVRLA